MRRAVDERHGAELLHESAAFLEDARSEGVYRQALLLGDIDVAEKTDRVLSGCQPIRALTEITEQRYFHLAKEFFNERRPKLRVIVKKPRIAGARAGFADVAHFDFSLPPRIQQIPV